MSPLAFGKKGKVGLTERLDVRVAPAEKAALREMAAAAARSVIFVASRKTSRRAECTGPALLEQPGLWPTRRRSADVTGLPTPRIIPDLHRT